MKFILRVLKYSVGAFLVFGGLYLSALFIACYSMSQMRRERVTAMIVNLFQVTF